MRIIFAGTTEIASALLASLLDEGIKPVAVYTHSDQRAGRGMKTWTSPVKVLARKRLRDRPLEQPDSFANPETVERLRNYRPDLIVTVAYGLLLPQEVLDIPSWAAINIHPSLLPRWRGASPAPYTIATRDRSAGVTIARMDAGLDTGAVIAQESLSLRGGETCGELMKSLTEMSRRMLLRLLDRLTTIGDSQRTRLLAGNPQNDDLATYAPKITKAQTHINWANSMNAIEAWVRALHPEPRARTIVEDRQLLLHSAGIRECTEEEKSYPIGRIVVETNEMAIRAADGMVCPTRVQLAGRKSLAITEFIRASWIRKWSGKYCDTPQITNE